MLVTGLDEAETVEDPRREPRFGEPVEDVPPDPPFGGDRMGPELCEVL